MPRTSTTWSRTPCPRPGTASASPRARRNEERRRGTCFWPQQGAEELGATGSGATRVQAAGRPDAGGAGGSSSSGRATRAGGGPGKEAGRAVPPRPRPPPAPHLPAAAAPARAPSGPTRPPHLAAARSSSPDRQSWAAAATARRGRRKERRKGRQEGRGGVATEEAGAAGPGVRGRGSRT